MNDRCKSFKRISDYVRMRDEKPIPSLDDCIHGIHTGTQWEAELRLSDLRKLLNDAARYRWLRDNSYRQYKHPIVVTQTRMTRGMNYIGPLFGYDLDVALDIARCDISPQPREKE